MKEFEKREIVDELQEAYLDYAMSVIVSRALPDVRDGLKPVHRRILWDMWDSGLTHQAKFRKSANVVGETMGRYHPHGDSAIYEAMVRMAQEFSLRYPLVQGQGNFGSVDGDAAAAMRYCVAGDTLVITEKGLLPIKDISKNDSEDVDLKVLSRERAINRASKWFDSGKHPTIRITTNYGYSLRGSYNHPVLVWKNDLLSNSPKLEWVLLSRVKAGDRMVIDRTSDLLWPEDKVNLTPYWPVAENRRWQIKTLPKHLDENLAFILGSLVSEGSISDKKIEFCNSDEEWILDFERRWSLVFKDCRLHKFEKIATSFGKKKYWRLEIHSQHVLDFLRKISLYPLKSKDKEIPALIFQSPKPVAAAFLQAYFEGDGSISYSHKMTELSCCSMSVRLIDQIQILLLRFGIVSAKRFDSFRNIHKLYIRSFKNYGLFQGQIGFLFHRKNKKLDEAIRRILKDYSQTDFVPFLSEYVRSNIDQDAAYDRREFIGKHNFDRYGNLEIFKEEVVQTIKPEVRIETSSIIETLLLNNYFFDSVSKVEKVEEAKVYSIKVDSLCHSFITNGFVSHNTESRLAKVGEEMLFDIEKETVDWQPNYDGFRQEPSVLPARLPNLLLNGSLGIAVGMTTNIPPHNLGEVVDAILHLADNPDAEGEDFLKFIKGPDFPTGGIIFDKKAIQEAYISGKGGIVTRAKTNIEERKNGQFNIVVTEIPYQVNKSELIKKIAELATTKKIEGIRDLRDESDREGLRVVVELKSGAPPQKILNQLYKHTDLQKNFNLNMIALENGVQPRVFPLKDILVAYLDYRMIVVRRRTEFDLKKAEERAHILEGLSKALSSIDKVIQTIKKSKDKEVAKDNLKKTFKFTEIQATAILEMRLQTLAALERDKISAELKEKKELIKELQLILKSPARLMKIIKDELGDLRKKYGDERRTQVVPTGITTFKEEDLVSKEEVVITFSAGGYIKRLSPSVFKSQNRGGKGLIGSEVNEEDFLTHFFTSNTHDNLLFFTDRGRVFQTKAYEIPEASRTSKGRAIHNFLELPAGETIKSIIAYASYGDESADQKYLVMATKDGLIKKTSLEDFDSIRRTGIIALALKKEDMLKWAGVSSGKDEMILVTKHGQSIRFKESQIRSMGRTAAGVKAIKLKKGDEVAGFDIISGSKVEGKAKRVLVVMENGYAKKTELSEYKVQSRGGGGIKTANVTSKTGKLVAGMVVGEETEILALSAKGQVIRTSLESVRNTGRAAQGVRIMNLKSGDKLAGVVVI